MREIFQHGCTRVLSDKCYRTFGEKKKEAGAELRLRRDSSKDRGNESFEEPRDKLNLQPECSRYRDVSEVQGVTWTLIATFEPLSVR